MTNPKKYVVFVDLDKTLLALNSGKLLVLEARKNRMISLPTFLSAIYTSIAYKIHLNPHSAVDKMADWLAGFSEELFIKLTDKVVEEQLIKSIRPSIVQEIYFHKKQGGIVVLLSASLTYICQPIAEHLQLDEVVCSEMEIENGFFTGVPKGNICIGPEKLRRAEIFCKANSFELYEAVCYGDSLSDFDLLNACGHPICVSPDKKLRKEAIKRNWKIIED